MSKICVKTFIVQKDGDLYSCQDRIAINTDTGRFAVADGVSNSYHPEITAEWLCELFTKENYQADKWPSAFEDGYFDRISRFWETEVQAYEATLSGRQLKHAMYKRTDLPAGASTLAGILVDTVSERIHYHILGDSSLFLFQENQPVKCFCTCRHEMRNGRDWVLYDNHPDCVIATQRMKGEWLSGTVGLNKGYVVLVTDGIAEWLQEASMDSIRVVEQLWEIEDHDSFLQFADNCRKQGKMDDDIALIILKIDEDWSEGYEVVFEDRLQEIPGMDIWKMKTEIYQSTDTEKNIETEQAEDNQLLEIEVSSEEGLLVEEVIEEIAVFHETDDATSNSDEQELPKVDNEVFSDEDISHHSQKNESDNQPDSIEKAELPEENLFIRIINKLKDICFGPTTNK